MTVITTGDGLALEALYHGGSQTPAVLIAAPHPRLGGSMDSAVCAELAWACSQRGHPTLRFNYRGVGASAGDVCGDARDLSDLLAAVRHLQDTHADAPLALVGYSFGASLVGAALVQGLRALRVVLIAPAACEGLIDWSNGPELGSRCLVVFGREDRLVNHELWQRVPAPLGASVQLLDQADHVFFRRLSDLGRLCANHVAGRKSQTRPPEE